MDLYDGPLFDCDNHYYEAEDAFHAVTSRASMQKRCVQWVEMDGKRYHLVAGKLNHVGRQPDVQPDLEARRVLREYYRGNPEGKTFIELIALRDSSRCRPSTWTATPASHAPRSRASREPGSSRRRACSTSRRCVDDTRSALCTLTEGFNRWLDDDWGLELPGEALQRALRDAWRTWSGRAASSSGRSSTTRGSS